MAKTSTHVVYYLFLLTFCIDEGDGRWKKTDREILQRDIKLYKKIAERVEHELQEYYTDYANEGLQRFHIGSNYYTSFKNVPKISAKSEKIEGQVKKLKTLSKSTQNINDNPFYNKLVINDLTASKKFTKGNTDEITASEKKGKWPSFEDILLAMGKQYDWKNDRWIKVKEKIKSKDFGKSENSFLFHEKHRFSYRTIKLNRGKNKRNVVIAVTAIR